MENTLLIWGIHPVEEALKACPGSIEWVEILPTFGKKRNQKALIRKLDHQGVETHRVKDFHRYRLPRGAVHQGICAKVEESWEVELGQIIDASVRSGDAILVCDQIEDPQNLGAIIRAAVAFFAAGLVIPQKQNAPINGTVVKASSGAIFHARISTAKSLVSSLEEIKACKIVTVGLDAKGRKAICEIDSKGPICLVLGSESKGIRKNVRRQLHMLASIPINSVLDSLNVSNAAAVALYEFKRRELAGK